MNSHVPAPLNQQNGKHEYGRDSSLAQARGPARCRLQAPEQLTLHVLK